MIKNLAHAAETEQEFLALVPAQERDRVQDGLVAVALTGRLVSKEAAQL